MTAELQETIPPRMKATLTLLDDLFRYYAAAVPSLLGKDCPPSREALDAVTGGKSEDAERLIASLGGWVRVVEIAQADTRKHPEEWRALYWCCCREAWKKRCQQNEDNERLEQHHGLPPGSLLRAFDEVPRRLAGMLTSEVK